MHIFQGYILTLRTDSRHFRCICKKAVVLKLYNQEGKVQVQDSHNLLE